MTKLLTLLALVASLAAASAADLAAVHASMTWTPVHSITNQTGAVRQARTATASKTFWEAWRADKAAMRAAGFSARPTTNGWQAVYYVKGDKQ